LIFLKAVNGRSVAAMLTTNELRISRRDEGIRVSNEPCGVRPGRWIRGHRKAGACPGAGRQAAHPQLHNLAAVSSEPGSDPGGLYLLSSTLSHIERRLGCSNA